MAEVTKGSVVDGRYTVLERIGSGGMADVWLADDSHLQRRVALKVLHARFAQDKEFVERFRREAEAAAGLQHPNIVAVFDRGEFEGTYYIAMQYLEGRTLKQVIDAGLTPEQAAGLIRQVLEGARFAHRHGVVHRDLKPQNVIVDAEGKATVTDFGIAQAGVSEITQAGSVLGTPHYLSPEQAQGFEVTAVSDLYSIGVMLYEALTRRVPFEADSAVAIAMKQVSQAPQRPSSINPQVSPALDAVVMRALEKEPGQRFQSADAFIAAIDAALKDPGGGAENTAAFAPLPPIVAVPEEPVAEGVDPDEEQSQSRSGSWSPIAVLIGLLVGFALTRDTTTEVPSVTGNQLNVAIALLQQDGFSVGDVKRVEREAPANEVLEQDPAAAPPADQASEDCSFLTFFCSKPKVTLTVSSGPGSAKVPSTAGLTSTAAEEKLEGSRLQNQARIGAFQGRGRRTGAQVRTLRRGDRDQGEHGGAQGLERPEAGQGAGRGRLAALAGGAADPRPRLHPRGRRSGKQAARRSGDPPGAERRLAAAARLDGLDHRLQGRRKGDGAQRDRQGTRRSGGSGARGRPQTGRAGTGNRSPLAGRPRHRPVPAAELGSETGEHGDAGRRQGSRPAPPKRKPKKTE